jgi:hypothetical protein
LHFVDAWTELGAGDLVRLLAPLLLLILSAFIPGQRIRQITALGVTALIPLLRELGAVPWLAAGWFVLWLVLGLWSPGDPEDTARRPLARVGGMVETGTVGLALGLVLALLLIAAVARQDMSSEETRRASYGAALLALGILHLMLRRHIRRAMIGFAAMGMGLQVLDGTAQGAQIQAAPTSAEALLVATWLAVALALKVAVARERYAGTGWVSDAHDLHD